MSRRPYPPSARQKTISMSNEQRRFDIVISDLDGCLSPEDPKAFNPAGLMHVADYNRAAVEKGDRPILTVCTGRPQPFVEAMCRLVQNMTIPAIAENGVWLFDAGRNEYVMDTSISDTDLEAVHDAEMWIRHAYNSAGFTIQPGKTASVSLYHPSRERMLALVPELKQAVDERGWPLRISTTWFYINCDLEHINKGTGIARLLERVGAPKERLAGIGDTHGDRFIADAVSYFACPGNADEEIRKRANYVSSLPEVDGVVDILGRLVG
jgi:hydroxymethylpyrimidine pyrophosphatase-like HAD family hydrolase